jgi:hypothetical protein
MTITANSVNRKWSIVTATHVTIYYSLFTLFAVPVFGAFEDVGTGARATALGGAYTALGDDTWSLLYNPAGLARLKQVEIATEYSQLYTGLTDGSNIHQYFVGLGIPLKSSGTIALGWKELGFSGLYSEQTMSLSYSRWIESHWAAGATLKYLRHSFEAPDTNVDDNGNIHAGTPSLFAQNGNARANVSMDLGLLYKLSLRQYWGISVQDVNQPNMALDAADTDRVVRVWRAGWAYLNSKRLSVTTDIDVSRCPCSSWDYAAMGGIEKWWGPAGVGEFAARGAMTVGNSNFQKVSMGFGYRWKEIAVDYAFVLNLTGIDAGATSGTHRFSIAYRFGRKKKDALEEEKSLYPEVEEFPFFVLKSPDEPNVALHIDPTLIGEQTDETEREKR